MTIWGIRCLRNELVEKINQRVGEEKWAEETLYELRCS